ncbi:MAG: CHAD domain-containing protein [Leptospiraceae bacterium]|nr:CHAD domain-containing protein [Leptospiraceae bacterium]MDW8305568.1 CHAD domain-containing protein [Leptospiraceae bacterium]
MNYRKKFRISGIQKDSPFCDTLKAMWKHHIKKIKKRYLRYKQTQGVEELHDLRISFRRLRYNLEPYCVCLKPNKFKFLYETLVELQNILGEKRDLDVMEEKLKATYAELGVDLPPALTEQWLKRKEELAGQIDEKLNNFFSRIKDYF